MNGKISGSYGWSGRGITIATSAQPGQRYDILVEAYAGHGRITVGDGPIPYGVETVPEPGTTQQVMGMSTFGVWREEIYQAALDFTTLYELRNRIDPLSLRVAEIDEGLMDATLIIDPELPEEEMLTTVRAGRERLKPLLERKNGPTAPTLYAFGHAHIDVAWLWPLQHTERKMANTAINQLALFEEYPDYKFLQSQPHLYWMLQTRYPELYERFKAAVKTDPGGDGRNVALLCAALARHAVLVRDCTSFELPTCIRVAVRTREENQVLLEALSSCMH